MAIIVLAVARTVLNISLALGVALGLSWLVALGKLARQPLIAS